MAVLPRAGGVIALVIVVQSLEGTIISPKIMSRTVKTHPLIILFALLLGGQLMGVVGMLLAIPAASAIKVLLRELYAGIYEPYRRERAQQSDKSSAG